ncbi:hypothetical protein [Streptomyces sp. NPDC004856]|uniref:hypothetical protein n=1 Tax=Streptomyces sp. NPDC004856 TaxID=3154556 RepID=UPI0033A5609C
MPRTSSSATILLTAAVAALTAATASGCVSVGPSATPKSPSSPSASARAPRPEGHAGSPVVPSPGRESLERTKPTTAPHAREHDASHPPQQPAPPATDRKPAPGAARHGAADPEPPAGPKPPRHPHPRNAHKPPKVPAQTDVCALGRKYGGWDPDSPQSAICHDAYGG